MLILMPWLAAKHPLTARAYTEDLLWVVVPIAILGSGLIIFAALKMMRLEAYRWAVAGSILAMIITPGNIIGLPIGMWALVVLTSREVKSAFPSRKKQVGKTNRRPGTLFGIAIHEHFKIVAIIRIGWGVLGLVIAVTLFGVFAGTGIGTGDSKAMAILLASGGAIALFPLVLSVPDIIAGVGLLRRRRWARILGLIMGVLDLPFIPIGAATGIYTIYVLMREETVELFAPASRGKESEPDVGTSEMDEESERSQEI
jgi:hypothetical protein